MLITLILTIPFLKVYSQGYHFYFDDKTGDEYDLEIFSIQEILFDNKTKATIDQKYNAYLKTTDANKEYINYAGTYKFFERPYKTNQKYRLLNEATSNTKYKLKKDGQIIINDIMKYPQVRNLPVFPDKKMEKGYSWVVKGYEVQDLRRWGAIKSLTKLPFSARYIYDRDDKYQERDCAVFSVSYSLNINSQLKINPNLSNTKIARIIGFFQGEYFWDKNLRCPVYYHSYYDFVYILSNGEVWEFKGNSKGYAKKRIKEDIKPKEPLITKKREDEIEEELKEKIETADPDIEVGKNDEGISINLGEILFDSSSYKLKKDYLKKLDEIAHILKKYENFPIRIDGHTDNKGSDQFNEKLSNNRAKAVLDYLTKKGIDTNKISAKGWGYKKPIADNKTEEGRQKNRRVEIIILTKNKIKKNR